MSIPEANPPEAGWPTHEVDFPEPVPDRVQQIWDLLHRADNKVFGMVMTVEDGKPVRLQYDRSLDIEGRNIQQRSEPVPTRCGHKVALAYDRHLPLAASSTMT
jgi:hypothetical protein